MARTAQGFTLERRGSARAAACLLIVVTCILCTLRGAVAAGVTHVVGDNEGWNINVNYSDWTRTRTFQAGDNLVFKYIKTLHSVSQVDEADFESCSVKHVVNTWFDGATTIKLPYTGRFYYLCGVPGHCNAGQKVAIRVVAPVTSQSPLSPASGPASAVEASSSPMTPFQSVVSLFLVLGAMLLGFW